MRLALSGIENYHRQRIEHMFKMVLIYRVLYGSIIP